MSLTNSYVEGLTWNVTLFGDTDFMKVIKIKLGHKGRTLIQQGWYPYIKRKRLAQALSPC